MTSGSRIPPLISPYVRLPPKDSLILCTHVLGASNNWLVLCYLYACLSDRRSGRESTAVPDEDVITSRQSGDNVAVVLVSWMREFDFWKTEARRSVGLDLSHLQQQGRFVFIDGLTQLCTPPTVETSTTSQSAEIKHVQRASTPPPQAIPISISSLRQPLAPHTNITRHPGLHQLPDPSLSTLKDTVHTALADLRVRNPSVTRIILILDTPTLPLALSPVPHPSPSATPAQALSATILALRAHDLVHATIINLPADDPFVDASRASQVEAASLASSAPSTSSAFRSGGTRTLHTPLETETAAFVAQCVGEARFVLGCRRLGSGWAGDVSGVLRAGRGGDADGGFGVGDEGDEYGGGGEVKEGEWLYHVAGDGAVKVWGRGSGMEGT